MIRRIGSWSVVGLLVVGAAACMEFEPPTAGDDDVSPYAYVRAPIHQLTADVQARTAFSADHRRDPYFGFGYVPRTRLAELSAVADVVELDARAVARAEQDPVTLIPRPRGLEEGAAEDYHDYDELTAELEALAAANPDVAQLSSAGQSVDDRELWVMKLSDNVGDEEDEPKLLYIANMHGDETVGRELMIYTIRRLLDEYGQDSRVTELLDSAQVYIMPSMNPDGFEAGRRYNANWVDLNRDFPDHTSDPTDTPAGRAPETQAVMELHREHNFVLALNFHGGEVCMNLPWDTQSNGSASSRFGDDPILAGLARIYADANPTMRSNSGGSFVNGVTYGYEWYEVNGGMQDWANYYRGSAHATVELSFTKYPSASQLPGMWEENRDPLLGFLESGLSGVHLRLVDDSGAPVSGATVRVASLDREITYPSSVVHRLALPGAQDVTISAPGHQTVVVEMEPWSFAEEGVREITLPRLD